MIDPTPAEVEALEAAGMNGGEVLDELGKTDVATLSPGEWMRFVTAIVDGYLEARHKDNNNHA